MSRFAIGLCLCAVLLLGGCAGQVPVFKQQSAEDPLEFKAAYEILNHEVDENGQPKYDYVEIPEDNPIVILDYEEMMGFFESGSGVIYLGRPGCPWCRQLLPALFEFAQAREINIYYYDVQEIRTDNGQPYQALLEKLDPWLPQDTVTQSPEDADFDPDLKRVVLPQLFFVKKGEIASGWLGYQDPDIDQGNTERIRARLEQMYQEMAG